MKLTRFLTALLAVMVLSSCSDAPSQSAELSAPPSAHEPVDWIAYQVDTSIALSRTDGTGQTFPGTDIAGQQTNPDWSPDGRQLVFAVTNVFGTDDLWTVGVDGTAAAQLLACESPCRYLDDPAWSPDGTKVMYSRVSEDRAGHSVATLETVTIADRTVEVVLTAAPDEFYAGVRWSPDGTSAVLERVHMTGPDVESDVDGVTLMTFALASPATSQRDLTDPALFAATADWAPDGQGIVFSALPEPDAGAPDLFTISPDGTGLTRLTTTTDRGGAAEEPAWSVDGTRVYFSHTTADGANGLAVVAATGGEVVPAFGETLPAGRHPRLHAAS
jgi:Tol biopolymer transport system component